MKIRKMTKKDKLKHYGERPLKEFIQFDIDGTECFGSLTLECMGGIFPVRILIKPNEAKDSVLMALDLIKEWIEGGPGILERKVWPESIMTGCGYAVKYQGPGTNKGVTK